MNPSITVVIPTFNRRRYIGEALESIWRQTLPLDEVIVVDDGSTDGTEEDLAKFAGKIKYLRQKNAGPSAARNLGLQYARSDWIALLDSDDLWRPEKTQRQVDFLRAHPAVEFVFSTQSTSGYGASDDKPEILDQALYSLLQKQRSDVRDLFDALLRINPIPTSSVIFRKTLLTRVGNFDPARWRCEDLDLWLRFVRGARVGFIDQPLVVKRAQHDNLINDYVKIWSAHLDVIRSLVAQSSGRDLPSHPAWRRAVAGITYRLASYELSHGRTAEASRWFSQVDSTALPPLSRDRALAPLKKALLALRLGTLARTVG